jgi:hypothetical protein
VLFAPNVPVLLLKMQQTGGDRPMLLDPLECAVRTDAANARGVVAPAQDAQIDKLATFKTNRHRHRPRAIRPRTHTHRRAQTERQREGAGCFAATTGEKVIANFSLRDAESLEHHPEINLCTRKSAHACAHGVHENHQGKKPEMPPGCRLAAWPPGCMDAAAAAAYMAAAAACRVAATDLDNGKFARGRKRQVSE